MKIAIPTRNDMVDDHFGHCEYYTIFTVSDDKKIETVNTLKAPEGCGCKSDIATVLAGEGVKVLIAGSMGNGALNKISSEGIQVIRGCSGNVSLIANSYINGQLKDSGESCSHTGDDGHECSH